MLTLFDINNIKVLHIEPTTVCQAACPQCRREDLSFYNDKIHRTELSLDQVKQVIPINTVKNLEKVFMCGVFGDPAAAKNTMQIFKWFRSINPDITLGMNTNGGLKTPEWWQEIGQLFHKPSDYVVFSIDGLEDTNHLYRKNVQWYKIIENVKAYTSTGASAHWDMLVFDHNKHQVNEVTDLAKSLGFSWLRFKVSSRFHDRPIEGLLPPSDFIIPPEKNYVSTIKCHALEEKSMYIAATGELLPCCEIGERIFNRDIILSEALQTENFKGVSNSWQSENPLSVCTTSCGVCENSKNIFKKQFVKEIRLK